MPLDELKVSDLQWRKARRSANNGACVEVAPAGGQLLIRDSTDQDGPVLRCSRPTWRAFVAGVRMGPFDPAS
jgi:hypothetical protein